MVMGCQGDIHLFSGPRPQLRGAPARMATPRDRRERDGEQARKHPAGAPPSGLAGSYWHHPGGGTVSQVLTGRYRGIGLRSRQVEPLL